MIDMTRQLWQPATARKELLNTINTKVTRCNGITTTRLDNYRLYKDASIDTVREYLSTRRMSLFNDSHQLQRDFDTMHIRLM